MVDYLSRYRLYGHGYTSPDIRSSVPSLKELYHDRSPYIFNRRPKAHDCRQESMKDLRDRREWEAWVLAKGLAETRKSTDSLRRKKIEKTEDGIKKPNKLLFNIGLRGRAEGDFHYPRGLAATIDSAILIADTKNHRVQVLNQFGVLMRTFGKRGFKEGQFNEPTGVTELPNCDIAVADKNNRRIQVFSSKGNFKYQFATSHEPFSVSCDKSFNIVVCTCARTIEIYRRGGKLLHNFPLGGFEKTKAGCQICVNNKSEVIVCDTIECLIKYFTYDGRLLYRFTPQPTGEGLSMVPSGICIDRTGDLVVTDALNHTVNVYSERGALLKQAICPADAAGPVQTCAIGEEGHLIVTEFSISGPHCVKIFRFRSCYCHITRPGSSKRRTPTPKFDKDGLTIPFS
ncbi:protein meiotic P26-like [Mytilus galloprovincialis]|uniref:protein meiotic P26-like n=1 Tax=Mytilus galloprovincialis TaxID=29158 RepID=UPI003F7B6063